MQEEEIRKFLTTYLQSVYEGTITADQSLIHSGVLDSFGYLEMIQAIEDHFNINFNPDEMTVETFRSIDSIVDAVKNKLN